ncbi:hypothetical protein F6Y03_03105 [Bacillus megaterium]|nr:hypothetical protein [Priestia megaterium]
MKGEGNVEKIFILVVLGYIFLSSKYFLQNYVYAGTYEQDIKVNDDLVSSLLLEKAVFNGF